MSIKIDIKRLAALDVMQGTVVTAAFVLLLVGTNAVNPLLPLYRRALSFDELLLSLTFVVYVVVLIATLFVFSRPRFSRRAPVSIAAALVLAIASDVLLATATEGGVLAGRAVAGVAGGIGTGAASALVVAALGARGRAVSATGNLVGAVVGSSFALVWVTANPALAPRAVFGLHAIACLLILVVAVITLYLRRVENGLALTSIPLVGTSSYVNRGLTWSPLVCGCLAWVTISCTIVLLPLYFDDLGMDLLRGAGPIVMLGASAVGQLGSPFVARFAPRASGMGALALGCGLVVAGGATRLDGVALAGAVLMGVGAGVAYRLGLVTVTAETTPSRQGSLASLYAAVTYGVAAAVVLGAGALASGFGLAPVIVTTYAALAVLSAVMLAWAPRLRNVPNLTM